MLERLEEVVLNLFHGVGSEILLLSYNSSSIRIPDRLLFFRRLLIHIRISRGNSESTEVYKIFCPLDGLKSIS